jgi:hypothetical protein
MSNLAHRLAAWSPTLAMAGGILWIAYAFVAMLHPWGAGNSLQNDPLVVTDPSVFRLTAQLGAAALLLLALALVGAARRLGLPVHTPGRFGDAMGWTAALAALIALGASLAPVATLTTASLTAGALLTPLGLLLLGVDAAGSPRAYPAASPVFVVGASGLLALAAQSLVGYFPGMIPLFGAIAMAIYGFGWVRLGAALRRS